MNQYDAGPVAEAPTGPQEAASGQPAAPEPLTSSPGAPDGEPSPSLDGSCAGADPDNAPAGCDGHGGCGSGAGCGHDLVIPELDARIIHPLIRQSAIFGVLVGLPPQAAVTIVAPNDPGPIVALLEERLPGEYAVSTTQGGQQEWRVTFVRRAA